MKDPRKLLNDVIDIIDKDINHVKLMEGAKLDSDTCLDLNRFAKTLLEIIQHQDADTKKAKEGKAALSDKDLEEAASRILGKKINNTGSKSSS